MARVQSWRPACLRCCIKRARTIQMLGYAAISTHSPNRAPSTLNRRFEYHSMKGQTHSSLPLSNLLGGASHLANGLYPQLWYYGISPLRDGMGYTCIYMRYKPRIRIVGLTSKYGINIVRLIPKESFSNKHLTRIHQFHELWVNIHIIHGDNFIR